MTLDPGAPLNALLIGLGQIGMGYDYQDSSGSKILTHAQALHLHPGYRLLGAIDPETEKRRQFSTKFAAPAFASIWEAADSGLNPEVIVIATPTERHLQDTVAVLRHFQPRLLVCEKPIACSVAEAQQMQQLCKAQDTTLLVNYMRRSEPGTLAAGELVRTAKLGEHIKGFAWYSKGLRHNGTHLINLLQHWLGEPTGFQILRAGRRYAGDCEPDVAIEFAAGSVVFQALREEAFSHYALELAGTGGRLRYDNGGYDITWNKVIPHPSLASYQVLNSNNQPVAGDMGRYQWYCVEQWLRYLATGSAEVSRYEDALTSLQLVEDIQRELQAHHRPSTVSRSTLE